MKTNQIHTFNEKDLHDIFLSEIERINHGKEARIVNLDCGKEIRNGKWFLEVRFEFIEPNVTQQTTT